MEYGAKFRLMRKRSGKTQEQLADELFVSRSTISRIESGKLKLAFDEAIRWAKKTDSQDVLIALTLNIDIAAATQIVTNSMQLVGMIFLGGF